MRNSLTILLLSLLLSLLPSTGLAQMISPALSPIVHGDRSITFALQAPEADSVKVKTKLQKEPFAALRDTSGLWSVTVGRFADGIHFYSFEVNGVRTIERFLQTEKVESEELRNESNDLRNALYRLEYERDAVAEVRRILLGDTPRFQVNGKR